MNSPARNFGSPRRIFASLGLALAMTLSLGTAQGIAATRVPYNPPDIGPMPMLTADAIPVVADHHWKKTSTSTKVFIKCMIDYGVKSKYNLRMQQFSNDTAGLLAFIVYAKNLSA